MRKLARLVLCSFILAMLPAPSPGARQESPFSIRGVVFGPYGTDWSHENRMDMIGWLAGHGMNTFVHMPAWDNYARVLWREPYPDETMAEFAREISRANELGLRWAPGIRPGHPTFDVPVSRPICFVCDGDFEVLAAKYQRFYDLGTRIFMLSFDDSIKVSSHPEDAVAFGAGDEAFGRMNAYLANRLQARFPDVLVIFGPADYAGTQRTDYLTGLGEDLAPSIHLYFTGRGVFSSTITAADADAFAEAVSPPGGPRRKLLIWDNYPVNDVWGYEGLGLCCSTDLIVPDPPRMPHVRMWFGPTKGRGADLVGHVEGLLSNPMNQAQASKVALYTTAAYLNEPLRYTQEEVECPFNPAERTRAGCLAEEEWLAGVRELGGASARPLLDFLDQVRSNQFDHTESPVFVARREAFVSAFETADWIPSWNALRDELIAEAAAGPALREARAPSDGFLEETGDHIDTLVLNATAGRVAAEMLYAQRPNVTGVTIDARGRRGRVLVEGRAVRADLTEVVARRAELVPVEAAMRASPYVVHGDRIPNVFDILVGTGDVFVLRNTMDEFLNHSHETTAGWMVDAPAATAGPLSVTVSGTSVSPEPDGRFSVSLLVPPAQRTITIVVTDAAGFQTARSFAIRA